MHPLISTQALADRMAAAPAGRPMTSIWFRRVSCFMKRRKKKLKKTSASKLVLLLTSV